MRSHGCGLPACQCRRERTARSTAATSDVVSPERFGTTYGLVFTGWDLAGPTAAVTAAALATVISYGAVYVIFLVLAALSWGAVGTFGRLAASHG